MDPPTPNLHTSISPYASYKKANTTPSPNKTSISVATPATATPTTPTTPTTPIEEHDSHSQEYQEYQQAAIMSTDSSPPSSRPSSRRSRSAGLSLDLSNLPPLSLPTPPSNTLIITNLSAKEIFLPANLLTIKDLINTSAPIHTWAPLKSFSRIIVSFYDEDAAIRIKQILDGEQIMGEVVKVYFGAQTNIEPKDEHLNLPDAGKLFFISPPPSPPHGWEMKLEDAPNKQVHADDLAEALAALHKNKTPNFGDLPASPASEKTGARRTRSSSTTIYDPTEHGNSPGLPAISVTMGDYDDEDEGLSPLTMEKPLLAHTSRPPIELMG